MMKAPNNNMNQNQPQSQVPSLPENVADGDHLPPQLPESFPVPYNFQNTPLPYMNPSFRDTLYDQELENQFGRLNVSSSSTHHHRQSIYGNNMVNIGGIGPVLGNNNLSFGFEELQRVRLLQSDAAMQQQQQQQQRFFNGVNNLRFLELERASNNIIPRSFNTNYGLQIDNEYYGGLVPSGVMNGYAPNEYNVYPNGNGRFVNNGENPSRYLLPSLRVENERVQSRRRVRILDLRSLRGSIYMVARDHDGCRFLQWRLDERKPEEIEMVFSELLMYVGELMVDKFGNFVIQKLFELCNVRQMFCFLDILVRDMERLRKICIDSHGTRTMQKFLEYLATEDQRARLVAALQHITLDLCKNMNGYHVIRHCLKFFTTRETKKILDVVVPNCIDIATDKSGCCVLQQCIDHAQGEHRKCLIDDITKNVLMLSENGYGNYVVQYLLGLRLRLVTNDLFSNLRGHFVSLSLNKYGSNVVEKCLKETNGTQRDQIILEIISHSKFLMVLQDSYGNYVAQRALETAQGPMLDQLIRAIQNHYPSLHSHPHGKRVYGQAKSSINKQHKPNNVFDDIF